VTAWRAAFAAALALGAVRCGKARPADEAASATPAGAPADQEPPVALNGDSPIQYPPRLYDQRVEGDVVLRLFVDSTGRLVPESSGVAEGSGYPALDSAALAGARKLRFAPARRHGLPIATAFLQPVEFRHPQPGGDVSRGEPDAAPTPRPAPVRAPASPPPPVRTPPRDTAPAKRDTFPRGSQGDSIRPRPDTAPAKPDTNATPR
jgi:TonB family protein